jgi:cytochrome c
MSRRAGVVVLAAVVAMVAGAGSTTADDQGLTGHGGPVRAMAVLADGETLVSGGFDSAAIVWDLRQGRARRVLRHHDSTVNAIVALAGGCAATGGEDGRIALWCGEASPERVLRGHTGPIAGLAVSPDGAWLASASWDRTVRLWPLAIPAAGEARIIEGHQGPVNAVAFTRDSSAIITAGYDGQLRLTGLAAGQAPLSVQLAGPLAALAVRPDGGGILTAGADGVIRAFSPTLSPLFEIALSGGPLTTLIISPDGLRAVSAGMRTPVTVVDLVARSVAAEILGPGLPVWSLALAPDGRRLYTGGADRAIRSWDLTAARPTTAVIAPAARPEASLGAERGAQVFRACRACHGLTSADTNLAGPTLAGIMGRRVAGASGYAYSEALRRLDIVWSEATISRLFEIGPNAMLPGTKMPEQRITDPEDRKALVEWLARVTGQ